MTEKDFVATMNGVASSWMDGNAVLAAGYFHDDAVYEEPPKEQFYRGWESILAFFTRVMSGDTRLTMKWRNLAFNSRTGVGFGEYTFARLKQFHGIVVIQFKDGKILKWREYQYESDLSWNDFAGESRFETTE